MKNTLEEKLNMILAKLTAFSRAKYLKADIEAELRKLQHEILIIVFDEEHALNAHLTIWDAYNHLAQINAERGGIADDPLAEFKELCKIFNNLIRAEISGNKGESMTAHRLSFCTEHINFSAIYNLVTRLEQRRLTLWCSHRRRRSFLK